MTNYDVLLTYGWVRSTYVASRSLAAMGLRVCTADEAKVGMCQWSNKSSFVGTYSSPYTDPEGFIQELLKIIEKTGVKFLLPSHDETEVIAKYRHLLPGDLVLPIANFDSIAKANDKNQMAQLAERIGVPIPQTIEWDDLKDLEENLGVKNWERHVVKLRRGNSSKGVFYPNSKSATLEKVSSLCNNYCLSKDRFPIVQQRVEGDGWGVSCLYWKGERVAFFTHKRLKEKVSTGGTSTSRVSVNNSILEEYAFKILDEMNWHGLAMVEFKYNEVTKEGWFIEVNPRLWGSIHLAVSCGVDFPSILYVAATEGAKQAKSMFKGQKNGVVARWYLGDVIIAAIEFIGFKPLKAIKTVLPGKCDTYDDVHLDDLGAFAGEVVKYLSSFAKTKSINPEKEGMLG